MSKISAYWGDDKNLSPQESFERWFASKFDDEYKGGVAQALNEGLKILKNATVANIQKTNFNRTSELVQGVVSYVDRDEKFGKVHILGKRGLGGFLRVFELGTYKKDGATRIKPQHWFTDALAATENEIPQRTLDALQKVLAKKGIM